ncbi:MAG: hypothetical protein U0R80_17905 [Nocardioidaceae bacterium]
MSFGLFNPSQPAESPRRRWLRDLEAWRLVLPDDAVFTHLTAAVLAGWWTPDNLRWAPAFAAIGPHARGPRRSGLVVSRMPLAEQHWSVGGLPLAAPEEVLLRCARDLGLLDLVPLVDSALRAEHVTRSVLREICLTSRPGCRPLRQAIDLADAKSESAWETKLRIFHVCIGVQVEPQFVVRDEEGRELARADLLVLGTNSIHEYDGAHHRDRAGQARDLRRERRLAGTPYVRRAFTADELINHPAVVAAEIDRALGRRTSAAQLDRWRRMIASSSHSTEGRHRLLSRWVREMGVNDWSQTA